MLGAIKWRAVAAHVVIVLLLLFVPFEILHRYKLVLPNHELGAPYHFEPRYANRRNKLLQRAAPAMMFTGDSRVAGAIDPSRISSCASFNFALGSETIPVAREVLLDTLAEIGKRPRYLVLGITPDFMVANALTVHTNTPLLLRSYRSAKRFLALAGPAARPVQRYLPAVFYHRAFLLDLGRFTALAGGAAPQSIAGLEMLRPITWSDYFNFFVEDQTADGWEPHAMSGFVAGHYPGTEPRAWLGDDFRADDVGLGALVDEARAAGIEPIFLLMPSHSSFYRAHPTRLVTEVQRAVNSVAADRGVLVLAPAFSEARADYYIDGQHLSRHGAELFSDRVDESLRSARHRGLLDACEAAGSRVVGAH